MEQYSTALPAMKIQIKLNQQKNSNYRKQDFKWMKIIGKMIRTM